MRRRSVSRQVQAGDRSRAGGPGVEAVIGLGRTETRMPHQKLPPGPLRAQAPPPRSGAVLPSPRPLQWWLNGFDFCSLAFARPVLSSLLGAASLRPSQPLSSRAPSTFSCLALLAKQKRPEPPTFFFMPKAKVSSSSPFGVLLVSARCRHESAPGGGRHAGVIRQAEGTGGPLRKSSPGRILAPRYLPVGRVPHASGPLRTAACPRPRLKPRHGPLAVAAAGTATYAAVAAASAPRDRC